MKKDDQFLDTQRFEKWGKNSFNKTYWRPTKKGWVIQGDFIINDVDTEIYNGPIIKTVKGNIYINNCKLKSLEGIFAEGAVIEGGLWIEECDNLVSLKGSPASVNTLTITYNPKLKSVEFAPAVNGNFYFERNGKKFKKEDIAKTVSVKKHIFCNAADEFTIEESFITESFKNHHFTRLAKQLKDKEYKEHGFTVKKVLLGDQERYFDQLTNRDIQEYGGDSPQALTIARRIFQRKFIGSILLMNDEGVYTGVFHGKTFINLEKSKIAERWGSSPSGYEQDAYSFEKKILAADTVIIINFSNIEHTYALKVNRQDARNGATAFERGDLYMSSWNNVRAEDNTTWERDKDKINDKDVRYYQSIANENRARYKKLLNQIKAERARSAANNFNKVKERVDKLFMRYTALLSKLSTNPGKYTTYEINSISQAFSSAYVGKNRYELKRTGLMVMFENYTNLMINAASGDSYAVHNLSTKIKDYEDAIMKQCDRIEHYLIEAEKK